MPRSQRRHNMTVKRMTAVVLGRESDGTNDRVSCSIAIQVVASHEDTDRVVQGKATLHHEGQGNEISVNAWHAESVANRRPALTAPALLALDGPGVRRRGGK